MTKIPMVLTSHDKLGDTGKKTGIWPEEFAAPVDGRLVTGQNPASSTTGAQERLRFFQR